MKITVEPQEFGPNRKLRFIFSVVTEDGQVQAEVFDEDQTLGEAYREFKGKLDSGEPLSLNVVFTVLAMERIVELALEVADVAYGHAVAAAGHKAQIIKLNPLRGA
jgi:hypothetical protein